MPERKPTPREKIVSSLRKKAEQYGQDNLDFSQPQPQTPAKPRELTLAEREDGALYVNEKGVVIYKSEPNETAGQQWREQGHEVAAYERGKRNERRYNRPHV